MGAEASSEAAQVPGEGGVAESLSRERPSSTAKPVIAGKAVRSIPRVLLRGERCSGKSSLFTRLHGTPFDSDYVPTERIRASSVSWSIRNSRERKRVSVELWDVVDEDDVTADNDDEEEIVVDVNDGDDPDDSLDEDGGNSLTVPDTFNEISAQKIYKAIQGVIFVVNPFSATSLEYVRRNMESVPSDIDVLIIVGFKDLIEQMEGAPLTKEGKIRVTLNDVKRMVDELKEDGRESITVIEASVYSGFGLRDLYKFLYLPFVRLQEQALRAKLDFLGKERIRTTAEVHTGNSDKAKYEEYVRAFVAKKTGASSGTASGSASPTPPSPVSVPEAAQSLVPVPSSSAKSDSASSPSISSSVSQVGVESKKSNDNEGDDYDLDKLSGDDGQSKGVAAQAQAESESNDDAMLRKQLKWMENVRQKDKEKTEKERETEKKSKARSLPLVTSHRGESGGSSSPSSGVLQNGYSRYSMSPQTLDLGDQADDSIDDFNPSALHASTSTMSKSRNSSKSKSSGGKSNALSDFLNSESVDSADGDGNGSSNGNGKGKKKESKGRAPLGEDSDDDGLVRKRAPSFKKAFMKPKLKKKAEATTTSDGNENADE